MQFLYIQTWKYQTKDRSGCLISSLGRALVFHCCIPGSIPRVGMCDGYSCQVQAMCGSLCQFKMYAHTPDSKAGNPEQQKAIGRKRKELKC